MRARTRSARRIVVADDNRPLRAVVEEVLVDAGYDVEAVGDGVEAVAAIERTAPALLLLDMGMPHLDGPGVLDHLRRTGRRFPVIAITARDEAGMVARERGAAGVLHKPLSLDTLLTAVRSSLP